MTMICAARLAVNVSRMPSWVIFENIGSNHP